MLFNSIAFLVFFPVVCLLYFVIPSDKIRSRNIFLLIASYYFYMNWEPIYALLLLSSTTITYIAAIGINHSKGKPQQKLYLICSLVLNLAILIVFKYYNFITTNIEIVLQECGLGINMPKFGLLLPVGISFYTFQAVSYIVDVYKHRTECEKNILKLALYLSFFFTPLYIVNIKATQNIKYNADIRYLHISQVIFSPFLIFYNNSSVFANFNRIYNFKHYISI